MDSNYESKVIDNIFKELDDKQSLYLMGLSLASNDLAINIDLLERYPEGENFYFFSNSISIIRELAKLVNEVDKSGLTQYFSENTKSQFDFIKSDLAPFDDVSLVKNVLKPIRDISFHYNFNELKKKDKIETVLYQIRNENEILISFMKDKNSPLGQRYTYADLFRTNVCNQFLTRDIVSKLSTIARRIMSFVDSLVNDILSKVR